MRPGVDVNGRDSLGHTPLFYAVMSRGDSAEDQNSKVRLLLDLGADINQTFTMNYQVEGSGCILEIAIRLGLKAREIYEILVQHAAKLVELNSGDENKTTLNEFNLNVIYTGEPIEWKELVDGIENEFFVSGVSYLKQDYAHYIQELREMKRSKIGDSQVSFFNLLTADVEKSVIFAKNRQIVDAFESGLCEGKFPIYQE